jgi:Uma2 family endonuclease
MTALPHSSFISVESYLQLDRNSADVRYEYIDGHVYAMSGGTLAHARIALNMAKLLDEYVQEPCHVHNSDVRVQVAPTYYFYPDVSVSCEESDWNEQADMIHAPCQIVEVLSPTTETYDRGEKFAWYQECPTIQEYVLINSRYQAVEVFRRKGDVWIYRRFTSEQEVVLESLAMRFLINALYERVNVPLKEERTSVNTQPV